MAEKSIEQTGAPQKAPRPPIRPRTGRDVPCARCGKPHWRKLSQLSKGTKSGDLFCSRECQYAVSAKVKLVCATCANEYVRFRSQAGKFCSLRCHNNYDLRHAPCSWPGCDKTLRCRVIQNGARDGSPIYKVDLVKNGQHAKYPFCPDHKYIITEYLGARSRFTGGRSQMLDDPEKEYDCRALSSRFTKMIIFERAGRRCECCATELDWLAPPKTWEMDHRIPIFRGGKTKLANMQILCASCHNKKSAAEKSEVALARHHSQRDRGTRWLTHYEKDQIITDLRQQVADLKARLPT